MALVVTVLSRGIEGAFRAKLPTGAQVGALLGSVYGIYAQGAQAGVALPVLTGTEATRFGQILGAAISDPLTGSAPKIAQAFADALTAFWTLPPVIFTDGVNAGPVPAVLGAQAMVGTLTATFSNLANTEATAAQQIASALDVATRSIVVTLLPSNVVVPLS
jgi:hypothetical protein